MRKKEQLKASIFRLGHKRYFQGQLVLNLGGVVFAVALCVTMFVFFGDGVGGLVETQVLVFVSIFFCVLIQCWAAITNTRFRSELSRMESTTRAKIRVGNAIRTSTTRLQN